MATAPVRLRIFGVEPRSIFAIAGSNENSGTKALGWALASCPTFLRGFLDLLGLPFDPAREVFVDLQQHTSEDGGFTDIELICADTFHCIVEAKVGMGLPGTSQLEKYAPRILKSAKSMPGLVSVSAAADHYAKTRLPPEVRGIPVKHCSWGTVRTLAIRSRAAAMTQREKLWLAELEEHLMEFASAQMYSSNLAYVVSLSGAEVRKGEAYSWIDVVAKDRAYYHPVGKGWPTSPPNYIAFRYHGELQSVHHIDSFVVSDDVSKLNPKWACSDQEHFVYRLGPPMIPRVTVKSGNLWNQRVWCAIDTLLSGSSKTIKDAVKATKSRKPDI